MKKQSVSSVFQLLIRVRYAECDAQHVVFNARYADYADLAATEFMRATLGGYQQLIKQGFDTQVVNLSIQWKSSAKFDDIIRLETHIAKAGKTSFTLCVNMFDQGTGHFIAECQVVYVLVSVNSYVKTPIPNELRQKLLAPSDLIIDMTGVFH